MQTVEYCFSPRLCGNQVNELLKTTRGRGTSLEPRGLGQAGGTNQRVSDKALSLLAWLHTNLLGLSPYLIAVRDQVHFGPTFMHAVYFVNWSLNEGCVTKKKSLGLHLKFWPEEKKIRVEVFLTFLRGTLLPRYVY